MKCKFERSGECYHPKALHGTCLYAEILQEQGDEAFEAGAQIMQEKILEIMQRKMDSDKGAARAALKEAMDEINALEVPK